MEHNNGTLLLSASLFFSWLTTITQSQVIGALTVIVLTLTAVKYYYTIKKERLEIKKLQNDKQSK